jgi:murein DD-endopeptidase MepM/ murein hydrolase activator NlpD
MHSVRQDTFKNKLILNKNHTDDSRNDRQSSNQSIQSNFLAIYSRWFIVFIILSTVFISSPAKARADIISSISHFLSGNSSDQDSDIDTVTDSNSQNVPLLQSSVNFNTLAAVGGGGILTADNEALMSEDGPSGTLADIGDSSQTGQISRYMVQSGDTLSSVAKMFGVSQNTILWANDITSKTLKTGQILVILPVSGTIHTVVKGDTLKAIAIKYKADIGEIAQFNNLDQNTSLAVGQSIIIPNGEGSIEVSGATSAVSSGNADKIDYHGKIISEPYRGGSGPDYPGYYIRPLVGGIKTQGLHGYNAVDIGTPVGTPLLAAASGEVIVARSSGWNGGYGEYVVISHNNGTQTLYGHMSQLYVDEGQEVVQGQVIGLSGNTGLSTGPHVHFEVRGAVNPLGP